MKKSKSTRVVPKPVGHPRKIGAAPGYGPRHAENAKEGEPVDLTQIPSDTVPAVLTPREAVLNRNAAELAGRRTIEKLNAEGNALAKKGVDLAAKGEKDVGSGVAHYAEGTSGTGDWQWKQDEDGNWVPFSPSGQTGAPPPIPWQDPTPVPTATPDPNVKINPPGGAPGGGSISGGPFAGWTPFQMDQWHSGAGPGSMGFPSFEGNTLGPGGQQLAFNTTSYNVPGYGWVPHAQLANAQASTNPQDYFNTGQPMQLVNDLGWDPSKPTYGFGSGEPSRRGIDQGLNVLGNATGIPGVGWGLGKLGRGLWHLYQNWQMHKADQQNQGGGDGGDTGDVTAAGAGTGTGGSGGGGRGDKWHDIFGPRSSASGIPGVGVGISPTGAPAVGREWWSPDFGRYDLGAQGTGAGNYNLAGPGGWAIGSRGTGFGNGTVGNWATAIGFDRLGAASGPSNLNFTAGAWGDDNRPHMNPYFTGGSGGRLTGGPSVKLRAKGDSDVEGKKNMKSKSKTSKPSGSPYAQGYEKLQGGGTAGGKDGSTPYGFQQHNINLATPGWTPPEHVGSMGSGSPPQWGGGIPVSKPPPGPPMHSGAAPYLGGGPNPGLGGGAPHHLGSGAPPESLPGLGGPSPMPYGWKQHQRNLGNSIPGLGGAGGGGGFYPPGQGFYAGGTGDVGIGDPNPQAVGSNFGAPPQLSAPDLGPLVAALTKEAQKQGLSASQIQSILGAFKGIGGGAGAGGAADWTSNIGQGTGGYQGGISDIGYPPFAAPGAEYHADKGSTWIGQYDPNIMIPRYQRGTAWVRGW